MKMIGLRYFRRNLQKVANKVKRGQEFLVLKRNTPLFIIKRYKEDEEKEYRRRK